MLLSLHPFHHLPLRRFCCRSSIADMAGYREAFARRMAMAGLKPHHRIALGVSGGPDSMALCVLTAGWKTNGHIGRNGTTTGCIDGLLGIVVDHKLRPGSSEEAEQVRDRVSKMGNRRLPSLALLPVIHCFYVNGDECVGVGIECLIACCDWSGGRPKQGHIQEAAREMRYQIFQGICIDQQIGVLLIAHHADDQAELFILRLSRNSGVLGLAGMAFASQIFPAHLNCCGDYSGSQGLLLVRPMLEFSKDDMYKICQEGRQEWVEDPTNQSQLFARNRIRISLRNLPSCAFRLEMQKIISACRLTRSYIENICHKMIKDSLTIMDHGYAIIDLEKLEPCNIEDICLSKFLSLILQFISQRHRPVRGSVSKLLLDYIRSFPCKISLTAAGCYLCAYPRSKGTKILVCCSLDSPHSSRIWLSHKYSCDEQHPSLSGERDQIIMDAKLYSDQLVPKASCVPFLHVKSSASILEEAKKLNLISESTYAAILLLKQDELRNFNTKTEADSDHDSRHEMKLATASSIPLNPGEFCHFMSRFLVRWKFCEDVENDEFSLGRNDADYKSEENGGHPCQFCMIDPERTVAVRHMIDSDWLYLAKLSKHDTVEDCNKHANDLIKLEQNAMMKIQCSKYMQMSARKALQVLKSIPVSGRRGLPVLVNSHGLLISVPSIFFQCCPCLSADAVFRPRVPLGGGYSSHI